MTFFEGLLALLTNEIFIVPACAWLSAQLIKATVNFVHTKSFSPARLFGEGGMPSGHSATVMSLTVMCGVNYGFGSGVFGIAFILAAIVMHDALGVRRETGKQGETIIELAKAHNESVDDESKKIDTTRLKTLVGHTPLQVVVGASLGVAVAVFYCLVLRGFFCEIGLAIQGWAA